MGNLPILPKHGNAIDWCGTHLDTRLPDFYMADFSVMALKVVDISYAVESLQSIGIRVRQENGLALADIGDLSEMRQALGILDTCGIDYEWSDIAQQIYQG
jgi:hypothetical protein